MRHPVLRRRIVVLAASAGITLIAGVMLVQFDRVEKPEVQDSRPSIFRDFHIIKGKAEAGDAEATVILAKIYAEGKQTPQNYPEAVSWCRKAADQGIAEAQYNLGLYYDLGHAFRDTPPARFGRADEEQAAIWHGRAAEQGHADAQYMLAGMYAMGRGVERNPNEALKWYYRAAEQGHALARYNLAHRYERGRDVPQDSIEAYKWNSLAADSGLLEAAQDRDRLKRRLTQEQLVEGRKRIQEFKAKQLRDFEGRTFKTLMFMSQFSNSHS